MTRLAVFMLSLASMAVSAADVSPPLADPVKQQRYKDLIHELKCLKCQGETIADTPAQFAVDIRRQVREMVEAGRSDHEVRQYMYDRYGDLILLRPRALWLWLAPGVFLLGGVVIAWRVLRQRRDMLASDTGDDIDEAGRT